MEFTQKLKSFRPAATVLEAEIARVRSSALGAGSTFAADIVTGRGRLSNEVRLAASCPRR